jgi:hypothetical protein
MSRETATLETLETLDRKLAELASFLSPSEILRALLEGTVVGCPRATLFLMRDGQFKGWNSIGYPPAASALQRGMIVPADSGWLAALASEEDVRWRSLRPGEGAPTFGQAAAAETVGLPVRVGGKAVAVLIAERGTGEQPWSPAALGILCQATRMRLELDLAWRRLKGQTIEPAAASFAPPFAPLFATPVATPSSPPRTPEAPPPPERPAAATSASELVPWGAAGSSTTENDPRREEARRYARLVATDIRLYNEEAVVVGRRQRDLTRRLGDQLQRGRDAFAQRFPDLGADGKQLLDDAFVQVLAGGDASLI